MPKVPIVAVGGPFDGRTFLLEEPYPLIPDSSLDLPGWFTADKEPSVPGQGYYMLVTPATMAWQPDPRTP